MDSRQRRTSLGQSLRAAAGLLGLGMQFAVTIVACLGIGYWLDSRFDTQPWALLAGGIIGIIGGFLQFLKTVRSETEKGRHGRSDTT